MFDCHICSKVMVKRRSEKKGHSLACQFGQTMESGDASDKEAPPTNPKKREPMRNTWLQVISMLVVMNTEDSLKQGSAMAITKRFNMACSIIYRLWEHAECMHAMAIINSPKLILRGDIPGGCLLI